jgi:hypothetical protein
MKSPLVYLSAMYLGRPVFCKMLQNQIASFDTVLGTLRNGLIRMR